MCPLFEISTIDQPLFRGWGPPVRGGIIVWLARALEASQYVIGLMNDHPVDQAKIAQMSKLNWIFPGAPLKINGGPEIWDGPIELPFLRRTKFELVLYFSTLTVRDMKPWMFTNTKTWKSNLGQSPDWSDHLGILEASTNLHLVPVLCWLYAVVNPPIHSQFDGLCLRISSKLCQFLAQLLNRHPFCFRLSCHLTESIWKITLSIWSRTTKLGQKLGHRNCMSTVCSSLCQLEAEFRDNLSPFKHPSCGKWVYIPWYLFWM